MCDSRRRENRSQRHFINASNRFAYPFLLYLFSVASSCLEFRHLFSVSGLKYATNLASKRGIHATTDTHSRADFPIELLTCFSEKHCISLRTLVRDGALSFRKLTAMKFANSHLCAWMSKPAGKQWKHSVLIESNPAMYFVQIIPRLRDALV